MCQGGGGRGVGVRNFAKMAGKYRSFAARIFGLAVSFLLISSNFQLQYYQGNLN